MVTFKQMEAMFWVVTLGGFSQAARKLHTTQSAVSKRVQELEAMVNMPLFDRTLRTARLTAEGAEMFNVAERLLKEREDLMRGFLKREMQQQTIRIGVTEVTAMTWLPRFVGEISKAYPDLTITPDVDTAAVLRDKLLANEIDLMIAADTFRDGRFNVTPVGKLKLEWMCRPGLVGKRGRTLRIQDLMEHRILSQGPQSGTGILFRDWFDAQGLQPVNVVTSNSMLAMVGLTVSGFGLTYLPVGVVKPMLDSGLLEVLRVKPAIPDATYVAISTIEERSSIIPAIVRLAQKTCDFTRMFQTV